MISEGSLNYKSRGKEISADPEKDGRNKDETGYKLFHYHFAGIKNRSKIMHPSNFKTDIYAVHTKTMRTAICKKYTLSNIRTTLESDTSAGYRDAEANMPISLSRLPQYDD